MVGPRRSDDYLCGNEPGHIIKCAEPHRAARHVGQGQLVELDHLDGKLYVDRLGELERKLALNDYDDIRFGRVVPETEAPAEEEEAAVEVELVVELAE